jgi:hypothetical protein
MRRRQTAVHEAWTIPVMGYLCGYLAFMAGIFFVLYWQLQPATIANAGQAAYVPPPQTRLIPLPRKMDAPQLADITPLNSSLEALAKLDPPAPSQTESGRRAKKRNRSETASRETHRNYRTAFYGSYDRNWQRGYRW